MEKKYNKWRNKRKKYSPPTIKVIIIHDKTEKDFLLDICKEDFDVK